MWCPHCGKDTRVLETDKLPEAVTRVRWCRNLGCRLLFETREVITTLTEMPGGGKPPESQAGKTRATAGPAPT